MPFRLLFTRAVFDLRRCCDSGGNASANETSWHFINTVESRWSPGSRRVIVSTSAGPVQSDLFSQISLTNRHISHPGGSLLKHAVSCRRAERRATCLPRNTGHPCPYGGGVRPKRGLSLCARASAFFNRFRVKSADGGIRKCFLVWLSGRDPRRGGAPHLKLGPRALSARSTRPSC